MTTTTVTQLDEQTMQELQPPCEVIYVSLTRESACDNAADWFVKVRCPRCEAVGAMLVCTDHKESVCRYGRARCAGDGGCGRVTTHTVEEVTRL